MNKKGFTLIELLAVIVILAIILLIAMPIVLNVINEARQGAFQSTGHGLVKTAENEYFRRSLDLEGTGEVYYVFEEGVQEVYTDTGIAPTETIDELSFTGDGPTSGVIHVSSEGAISMWIHDGTHCVYKDAGDTAVEVEVEDLAACAVRGPDVTLEAFGE